MAPMYYRNANAALLVFDVTNYSSFNEVKSWILELQKNVQEPMFLLLVGNKIDLEDQRAVSREDAFIYAHSIGAKYIETSAIHDQGIEQVFVTIGLGLINLSSESCSTIKRYESKDSLYSSTHSSYNNLSTLHQEGLHMAISIDPNAEANGIGRVEVGPWSRDHVAHGEPQRNWCC
jgi:Ras-related protein Rab-21